MHIIFGYHTGPSYGEIEEQDGGFSIDILINGIIENKTYIFDNKEKSRETYKIDNNSLCKIKDIINFYKNKIDEIPNHLDLVDEIVKKYNIGYNEAKERFEK